MTAWNGLYAPAGTPDAIVQTLNKALHDVLADPARFNLAFNTLVVPCLGFIFLPWTLLAYLVVWIPSTGVTGFGWVIVGLGLLADIATYYWATDLRPALANNVPADIGKGTGDIDYTKDVAWWQHVNFSAISLLFMPFTIRHSTSRSRSVRSLAGVASSTRPISGLKV